jgi:hypothetical protein
MDGYACNNMNAVIAILIYIWMFNGKCR